MPATRARYSLIVTIDQAGEAREFVTSAVSDGVRAPPPGGERLPGIGAPAPSPAGLSRKAGAKPVSTSTTARLSGLSLRHVTRRGPSWRCADRVHIDYASSRALHPETGFPDPVSDDRLPLPFLRPAHASDSYPPGRPSGDGGSSVTLLPGHQRPDDARHPVGQRHGDQHPRLARQHPGEPRIVPPAAPDRPADDRHGTRDQQTPEIVLAHLRYLAQPRLAAGRVLARHQAEPGGDLLAPVMSAGAGLHRHLATRLRSWKFQYSPPAQLLAERHRSVGPRAVQLKAVLRKIDPDHGSLVQRPFPLLALTPQPTWHIAMPSGGASTPSVTDVLLLTEFQGCDERCRIGP